ncbi:hypothetical protein BaRGS_00008125 [Batillaria attramentaria]|uniref:Uncharacterized protein n=1 Tax=Batillaria attramentaria TaxID=370345 RepID=A0ABD0LML8_9CAEN
MQSHELRYNLSSSFSVVCLPRAKFSPSVSRDGKLTANKSIFSAQPTPHPGWVVERNTVLARYTNTKQGKQKDKRSAIVGRALWEKLKRDYGGCERARALVTKLPPRQS